jgi:DNA-binding NtrC family response regulator
MKRFGRRFQKKFLGISDADMGKLLAYHWPGNISELENLIERSALLCEPPTLFLSGLELLGARPSDRKTKPKEWVTLEECERRYLREVLAHTNGKLTGADGAAAILGLKPSTLHFRIDKLGIRTDLVAARVNQSPKGSEPPKSSR